MIADKKTELSKSVRILNERGALYYDQKQYAKAIEVFDQVLAIDSNNEYALLWKIASHRLQRHFAEADTLIQEALKLLPNSVPILNERGALYNDQKQYDKAIEVFDQVLAIDSKNEFALQGKISSLRLQLRVEEADMLIQEALKLLPNSVLILNERGVLY